MLITFSVNPKIHADIIQHIEDKTREHGGNRSDAMREIVLNSLHSNRENQVIAEIQASTQRIMSKLSNLRLEEKRKSPEEPNRAEQPSEDIQSTLLSMKQRGQKT